MMISSLPFSFLFSFVVIFGTILSLSSSHWLIIWAGLEINLLGFIPLIISRNTTAETQSGIKYFLIQALGSSLLMLGSLHTFSISSTWEVMDPHSWLTTTPLILSLILKLGAFPFHFWLPPVMAGLSWLMCLTLATWQKLAPLFLLSSLSQVYLNTTMTKFMLIIAGISSLIGGLGGINQTQIRAILAYSSIGHIGWMLLAMTASETVLKMYFLIYIFISLGLFSLLLFSESPILPNSFRQKTKDLKMLQISLILMLLSLGGLPPLLGFVGKWATMSYLTSLSSPITALPLIAGSLISLFYYLSLLFSLTLASSKMTLTSFSPSLTPLSLPLAPLFITSLILMLNISGSVFIFSSIPLSEFL
uniref:NADH-ubiquinone oxidoreductase chain 2 n=1 Tax=Pseudorimula sp. RSIO35641 TaxID=2652779 RepID=A0A5J6VA14_9VEST|nr:NADH dehydrogenase subunit 2 [Pseudorimula sp. RSIO35641]